MLYRVYEYLCKFKHWKFCLATKSTIFFKTEPSSSFHKFVERFSLRKSSRVQIVGNFSSSVRILSTSAVEFFNGEHFGLKRLKIWKHPEEDAAAHFCDSRWKGTYVAQRKVGCPLHAPAARWTFSKKIFSLQTNCIVTRSCLRCCVHMLHHLDDRNCSLSIIKNDFHSSGTLCSISARTCMLTSLCLCTYSNGDPGDRLENSLALTGIF